MKNKVLICALSFFILISLIISGCGSVSNVLSNNITQNDAELTVSFIDVGQGDSTLIECNGAFMLIDAGLYSERYAVTSYLSRQGIDYIDYCVATHPHADHIGGMSEVIYSFNVGTLIYPVTDADSDSWNYVLDAADEKGVTYSNPEPGDTYSLGGATLTVLSPEKDAVYSDLNDYSLVLKLEYEDVSFIFTGDAEAQVEKSLLHSGFDLSADVLKCGHHGSSTSSSAEFVRAVNPSAAVISCGQDNEYGHPHEETMNTLNSQNILIYRTDTDSTVVARSDGESITFTSGDEELGSVTANTETASDITGTDEESSPYIGNKNSKVFHSSSCGSVTNMKDKNKVSFDTREDATAKGYTPCGSCNP